jgi:hypothetical protein
LRVRRFRPTQAQATDSLFDQNSKRYPTLILESSIGRMSSDEEDTAEADGAGPDDLDDEVEPSDAEVADPRESDVLCGRGGAALRHPGNQTYRRLVNLNKALYIACLKTEKLKISRSIVAAIREQKGRFLERDAKKGTWYDIGDKKAIEKTSQALREGQPKLRKKMVELGQIPPDQGVNEVVQQYGNGIYAPQQRQSLGSIGSIGSLGSGGSGGYASSNNYGMQHHMMRSSLSKMPPPPSRTMSTEMNSEMALMQRLSLTSGPQSIPSWTPSVSSMGTALEEAQARSVRNRYRSRGSNISQELGMQSNYSMMSDFSAFGPSDRNFDLDYQVNEVASMDLRHQQHQQQQLQQHQQQLLLNQQQRPPSNGYMNEVGGGGRAMDGGGRGMDSRSAPPPPPPVMSPMMEASPASSRFDRRRLFAKMKYSQPTSNRNNQHSQHSIGDGMPDIHMVDSQYSLLSNLSGHGSRHHAVTRDMDFSSHGAAGGGGEAKESIGSEFIGVGSRRSLMSGLSRISGHSDVNNPFSDMSKRIGGNNISNRSIAMSEISGIEEGFAEDMDEFNFDLPPRGGAAHI